MRQKEGLGRLAYSSPLEGLSRHSTSPTIGAYWYIGGETTLRRRHIGTTSIARRSLLFLLTMFLYFTSSIAALVAKLPNLNRLLLHAVAQHLEKVQIHQEKNKMTVQNLGVCFGPTLLRDKEVEITAPINSFNFSLYSIYYAKRCSFRPFAPPH